MENTVLRWIPKDWWGVHHEHATFHGNDSGRNCRFAAGAEVSQVAQRVPSAHLGPVPSGTLGGE